jgi:hypothetical protein
MLSIMLHRRRTGGAVPTTATIVAMAVASALALAGGILLLVLG